MEKKQGAYEQVQLDTLNNGQVVALFDRELAEVLANIADENTSAKAKRDITIKIAIRPEEDRESATVEVSAKSSVAPVKPSKSFAVFSMDRNGKVSAYQTDPKQLNLGMEKQDDGGKIVDMPKAAGR